MPTFDQARIDRLELAVRRLEDLQRRVDDKLALLDQRSRSLGASAPFMSGGGGEGGGGGGGWFGSANGVIDGRVGSAPGTGSAMRFEYTGAYMNGLPPYVDVLNLSEVDVPSGKAVWIELGADGYYYAAPLGC